MKTYLSDKKVLLFSAGRTGSTFIWQCLKELFPEVVKCHQHEMRTEFINYTWDCVITDRNPIDAYLSRVRCVTFNGNTEAFLENINSPHYLLCEAQAYKAELNYVENIKKSYGGRVLTLSYEMFFDGYPYLYKELEKFFGFTISPLLRTEIEKVSDKEKNISIQKAFSSFGGHDPKSLIHGSHIWKGYPDYSREVLTSPNYRQLQNIFA